MNRTSFRSVALVLVLMLVVPISGFASGEIEIAGVRVRIIDLGSLFKLDRQPDYVAWAADVLTVNGSPVEGYRASLIAVNANKGRFRTEYGITTERNNVTWSLQHLQGPRYRLTLIWKDGREDRSLHIDLDVTGENQGIFRYSSQRGDVYEGTFITSIVMQ